MPETNQIRICKMCKCKLRPKKKDWAARKYCTKCIKYVPLEPPPGLTTLIGLYPDIDASIKYLDI